MKKLKIEDDAEAVFRGVGIVSPEKEYRLCFFLNRALGLEFEKNGQLHIYDPAKNKRQPVACYYYQDSEGRNRVWFAKNKQEGFFMLPDMKKADYLLLEPAGQLTVLSNDKKITAEISSVQSCFALPSQNLKNIDAE